MKQRRIGVGAACLVLALGGAAGCSRDKSASAQKDDGSPVVAAVGDSSITQKELEARLAEQPAFVRARYDSLEKKKEFLDNLVRFELLVQEARRRGLDADPQVQEMLEKVMVQRLISSQTEGAQAGAVAEEEAQAYYEQNRADYVKPERVRVSHLLLTAAPGTPEREKARTRAVQLAAEVKAGGDVLRAFDAAARAHSQDAATQTVGGDLGFLTREELIAKGGAQLAESAFSLQAVGQLSGAVESDHGVHLLQLAGRQAGMEQSFESVKARITQRLSAERRAKALDTLVQDLRAKTAVKVDEAVLGKVDPKSLGEARTADSTP